MTNDQIARAIQAYGGAGHLDPEAFDQHLAETAHGAARALLYDSYRQHFPHALHDELLSAVAALRAALGFSATPTATQVRDWQERQVEVQADARAKYVNYPVAFVDGPYEGVEMTIEGPAKPYPAEGDPLGYLVGESHGWKAGPRAYEPVEIVWGPPGREGSSSARYKRDDTPLPDGRWQYRLRTDDPAPPAGARPPERIRQTV
ncbi:hypothetical protein [Streptomyces sp. NPDC088707]|uniref:hypothetical protein n=1 Tax=Streptomyces sp. NPDC088707 TaxID=3365871 RepID=UPI0038088068